MSSPFYVLREPRISEDGTGPLTEAGEWRYAEIPWGPAPTCPECGAFVGPLTWLPPFEVELESWSSQFGDIVFGLGQNLLVSQRFKLIWHEHGLTGLSGFEPVTVKRVVRRRGGRADAPLYYRAIVAYAGTSFDEEASGFEPRRDPHDNCCRVCRAPGFVKRWRRIVIREGTFSGEDVGIPRDLGVNLVTDRFKKLCDEFGIKNTEFIPIEQYAHDYYPWEKSE